MQIRWLGWAGVEIEADGERVVIDPLQDPLAVFAPMPELAADCSPPDVVAPSPGVAAALVTHLHRDHADAAALAAALRRARRSSSRSATAATVSSSSASRRPTRR
jgi:L-ascorbate metabolism protein UlaG (beta-lactamase superfamily)